MRVQLISKVFLNHVVYESSISVFRPTAYAALERPTSILVREEVEENGGAVAATYLEMLPVIASRIPEFWTVVSAIVRRDDAESAAKVNVLFEEAMKKAMAREKLTHLWSKFEHNGPFYCVRAHLYFP